MAKINSVLKQKFQNAHPIGKSVMSIICQPKNFNSTFKPDFQNTQILADAQRTPIDQKKIINIFLSFFWYSNSVKQIWTDDREDIP